MTHEADFVVLGIDDHVVYRRGLRMVLESSDPAVQVIEAASIADALAILSCKAVSVVLLELAVCGAQTDGVVRSLVNSSATPVVVFSKYGIDDRVVAALRAGANGHVNETSDVELFLAVLRRAASGEYVLDEAGVRSVVDAMRSLPLAAAHSGEALTTRENEILILVCAGYTNRQIAQSLALSESTVKNHLQAVFRKLHVFSRAEAVTEAHRLGLLADDLPCSQMRRQGPGPLGGLPA